ncbi:MAG: hypothetical protein ACXWL2_04815 [Candidatus Chromulinivorax sp.]
MKKIIVIFTLLVCLKITSNWNDFNQKPNFSRSYQVTSFQTSSNSNLNHHVQTHESQSSSKIGSSYTFSSKPIPQQKKIDEKTYTITYTHGSSHIVDQKTFEKELQKTVDLHIQNAQNYFGCNLNHLALFIKKALEEGAINTPATQNKFLEQTIYHLVKTNQTEQGIINIYRNHPWAADKDFTHLSDDKKIMINYAIARMADCTDSKTIELAQACLENFDNNDYQTLQSYNVSNQTTKELNTTVLQQDFITALNRCTQSINTLEQQPLNDDGKKYLQKLYQRETVIIKTLQNSPCVTKFTTTHFALPTEVAGYLMAHNINYAAFNNQNCIYFQHLLTKQIIDILKTNVGIANKNLHNDMIAKYIYHTCNLAVGAQQINQAYQIAQATLLTDVAEIATIIGQSAYQATIDLTLGIANGTFRSLQSWLNLAQNLCVAPIKTTQEGIHALVQTAEYFGQVIKTIDKHAPHMNISTFQNILDSYDDNNFIHLIEDHPVCTPLSEQYKTLKTNISMAIDYSIPIIETMLNRPAQENIADVTQCVVDGIIINKIGLALSYLANFGKTYLTQVAQIMDETLPTNLLDQPLHFATTPIGDMVAYLENSSEFIKDANQVKKIAMVDRTILIAQANNLYNKINNFGSNNGKQKGVNKEKISVNSDYTYKHGTYDGAHYHKKDKTTNLGSQTKSPSPEDGQKCLDNSYGLDKYVDRVAIENNKYVVLYSSNNSTYHGFVCSEWKDVPKNMQEIFRKHKLVHPKSGALNK